MTDRIEPVHRLFTDGSAWADVDAWNRSALALHDVGGVHRIEAPGYPPFWAVIDHAALLAVERNHELFANLPAPVLSRVRSTGSALRTLVHLDEPEHRAHRAVTADRFTPRGLARLDDDLERLADEALDRLAELGGRCDFALDIARPFALKTMLRLFGVGDDAYHLLLLLTLEAFGMEDDDLYREAVELAGSGRATGNVYQWFHGLAQRRRLEPLDDVATAVATGQVDGKPLSETDVISYYLILTTAGHDTTSSVMAGGMDALLRHPDQLARLRAEPDLLDQAVEEMLRWTTPVRHFMRNVTADTEILGQPVPAGDWVYLAYKAANLDPKVFEDPLRFDITRANAARHVSFGSGIHHCLGARLARNELRILFRRLLPRLVSIESDGPAATMTTTFVGGHKRVPIRYELTG